MICAFFAARSLYNRRKALLRTVSVVELSTTVVLNHPPILLLSLGLLLVALIASIPFLSLILRLTLIGYYTSEPGTAAWHISGYAGWLAFLATVIWVWSWGVVRGVLKVAVSGVVGDWYFNNLEPEPARPTTYEVTHAAFSRASGPSLGSICVSTLVLTFTQVTIFILRSLRRISTPPQLYFLASLHPLELIAGLIAILDSLGSYTLTYIGLTGEKFWVSAKQSRELVSNSGKGSRSKGSRAGDCKSCIHNFDISLLMFDVLSRLSTLLPLVAILPLRCIIRCRWGLRLCCSHTLRTCQRSIDGPPDGWGDIHDSEIRHRCWRRRRRCTIPLLPHRSERRSGTLQRSLPSCKRCIVLDYRAVDPKMISIC